MSVTQIRLCRNQLSQLRGRSFYSGADLSRADYFLRKRSSRTTSAPSPGFAGSSLFSGGGAGTVSAEAVEEGAATAGRLAAGGSATRLAPFVHATPKPA